MSDQAIEQFRTTLQQQPDYGPASLNLALVYQMKGDNEAAKQILESYVQEYGNSSSPYIPQAKQRLKSLR